jgi:signal transduction histidine kinase
LGLYVVQEVIAAHEGQIVVDSEVGKGTTFTITLPRVQVEAATLV